MQFREKEIDGCFTKFDGNKGGDFGAVAPYNPNGCIFNASRVVPVASKNQVDNIALLPFIYYI